MKNNLLSLIAIVFFLNLCFVSWYIKFFSFLFRLHKHVSYNCIGLIHFHVITTVPEAGVTAQRVKPLPVTLAPVPACPVLIPLLASVPVKAVDDVLIAWAPAIQLGNLDRVNGYCLWPDLAVAAAAIWGMNKWTEELSVLFSLPLSITLLFK